MLRAGQKNITLMGGIEILNRIKCQTQILDLRPQSNQFLRRPEDIRVARPSPATKPSRWLCGGRVVMATLLEIIDIVDNKMCRSTLLNDCVPPSNLGRSGLHDRMNFPPVPERGHAVAVPE
jgi:hypothetical protein